MNGPPGCPRTGPPTATRRRLLAKVRSAGRTLLTEVESKDLLRAYGLPVVPTDRGGQCGGGGRRGPQARLSRRAEAAVSHHHPQERCGRRPAELGR